MKSIDFLQNVANITSRDDFNKHFESIGKIKSKCKREIFIDLLLMGFSVVNAIKGVELVFSMTVKSRMNHNDVLKMAIDYRQFFDLWDENN